MTSAGAEVRTLEIPFSECAMHCRLAGQTLQVVECDRYVNGNLIPPRERRSVFVITADGARVPMTKGEAGWRD